jgi:lycopene cyclase domain-containing protein
MKFAYLIWLAIFVWIPIFGLWAYKPKLMWRHRKTLGLCIFWALVFSVPWDIWSVRANVWVFPPDTNIGIIIGGLPLEEYLFFIFAALFVASLTLVLKDKIKMQQRLIK